MAEPAVLQATFADWRTVKGRKQLQLIFEVPIEQQAHVLSVLGAPLGDSATWVAIARLQAPTAPPERASEPPNPGHGGMTSYQVNTGQFAQGGGGGRNPDAADRARQRRREMTPEERMVGDAAMLCEREKFWGWIEQTDPGVVIEGVADANKWLTEAIGGRKREIAIDPRVREKYRQVETDFRIFAGEMQAPR